MKCVLILTLVLASMVSYSQKAPLEPGKPFPYKGILNIESSGKAITMDSFLGKPVLIDLFGRNCLSGFSTLPLLDSICREFKDSLQVLLIGYKDDKLPGLYEKYRKRYNLAMPYVLDTMPFNKLEFYFLPTYIWIGPDGLVKAVSSPDEVSRENISKFVSGQQLPFSEQVRVKPIQVSKDFLSEGNGGTDTGYLVRIIFSKWDAKQPYYFPTKFEFSKSSRRYLILGATIVDLYRLVTFGVPYWSSTDSLYNIAFDEPEIEGFSPISLADKYNFAVSFSGDKVPPLKDLLSSCLVQYFGYKASIVKKKRPYYSVTVDPAFTDSLRTKGGRKSKQGSHAHLKYINVRMSDLIFKLSYYTSLINRWPFIDETGINYNIDIAFDAVMIDQKELFEALGKKGILIQVKEKVMDVLVLTPI